MLRDTPTDGANDECECEWGRDGFGTRVVVEELGRVDEREG